MTGPNGGALQHPGHQQVPLVTEVKARVAREELGEDSNLLQVLRPLLVPGQVGPYQVEVVVGHRPLLPPADGDQGEEGGIRVDEGHGVQCSDPGEGGEEYERGGHPRHVLAPAMVMVSSPLLRLTQVPLLRTLCQVVIPRIFVRILFRG